MHLQSTHLCCADTYQPPAILSAVILLLFSVSLTNFTLPLYLLHFFFIPFIQNHVFIHSNLTIWTNFCKAIYSGSSGHLFSPFASQHVFIWEKTYLSLLLPSQERNCCFFLISVTVTSTDALSLLQLRRSNVELISIRLSHSPKCLSCSISNSH